MRSWVKIQIQAKLIQIQAKLRGRAKNVLALQSGWKVSLDCNNPEAAVYKFEKAGRFLVEEYLQNRQVTSTVLPAGWIAQQDPSSGQTYYYNQQTGQTQWDFPQY